MPYCPKCGKEVSFEARYCPQCGASLVEVKDSLRKIVEAGRAEVEKVIHEVTAELKGGLDEKRIEMEELKLKIIYSVVEVVGIIVFLVFITVPEILTCPVCHGTFLIHYLCSFCGGDGKVTILEYILYLLGG